MAESVDAILDRISADAQAKFDASDRGPFIARSASDKTDNWPHWMVVDHMGLNVTVCLAPSLRGKLPFIPRAQAQSIAEQANHGR